MGNFLAAWWFFHAKMDKIVEKMLQIKATFIRCADGIGLWSWGWDVAWLL